MLERFIRYCKINTRSDANSFTTPSTLIQFDLLNLLKQELEELGLKDVELRKDNAFVTATLPSNVDYDVPSIGFIAHVDTADYESENVKPQVVENYDGNDILLNKEKNIYMKPSQFPNLKDYIGHTLITTDGTTLLGADDKAGVAEIVEAIKYLIENPQIPHGEVKIAFGPDEEIGRGADKFDAKSFATKFAYTMDGAREGELEYESFNAACAKIKLKGVSVHPGSAYGLMVNVAKIAFEIDEKLPKEAVPELTRDREGFFLLTHMNVHLDTGEMTYIIRDHDKKLFESKKELIKNIVNEINEKYQKSHNITPIELDLFDQYYNMYDIIKDNMESVDLAIKCMEQLNIKPHIMPIRGGTDGSKISFMGIPTPNLFVGAENLHGQYEFASLNVMEKAKNLIIEIIKEHAKNYKK